MDSAYLKIGLIKKPHGIRGELKILPLTDNPERFALLKTIYLMKNEHPVSYSIEDVRITPSEVLLKLSGVSSRDDAELLRNIYLYIDHDLGLELAPDEFYTQDLIGCTIFCDGENRGEVLDVVNNGAQDNLLIRYQGKDYFFPLIKDYIVSLSPPDKLIEITNYEDFV